MIKAAKYPCNGREYTVTEIARILGVSSETVRIRLSKYGGDMQKVYDHYTKAQPRNSEDAVSEIMSALGLGETEAKAADQDEEPAPETQEPKQVQEDAPAEQDTVPEGQHAVQSEEEPAEPEEVQKQPTDAAPLAALRRLNRAIEAVSGLYEGDVGGLNGDLKRVLSALRTIRATRYEKYVDWNAVAYAGLRGVREDEG